MYAPLSNLPSGQEGGIWGGALIAKLKSTIYSKRRKKNKYLSKDKVKRTTDIRGRDNMNLVRCGDVPGVGGVEPLEWGISGRSAPRLLEEDVFEA